MNRRTKIALIIAFISMATFIVGLAIIIGTPRTLIETPRNDDKYTFTFTDSALLFNWIHEGDTLQYTVERDGKDRR